MSKSSNSITLSKSDIRILNLLQEDASCSRQEIADNLGMSLSTVSRRIAELDTLGVIKKRVALLDPDRIGLSVSVFVFVNLVGYESKIRDEFEEFAERSRSITECVRVTGGYDYIVIVRTQTVSSFEKILMDEILAHSSVSTASSTIALRQTKHTTALAL